MSESSATEEKNLQSFYCRILTLILSFPMDQLQPLPR